MFEIKEDFYWNGEPLKIISGSIHYFRVVPEYWEDRLLKLKAMGCNTVETYIPWNIHEPKENEFNFEGINNIHQFIQTAHDLDLFVIVRPSPYICAEWEFGGLPSWLLKDRNMRVRTAYEPYLEKVERFFERLLQELVPLQYTNGGPILMMQVENEYGSYNNDKVYMNRLVDIMLENGVDVPLVTSDGTWLDMMENGALPKRALPTANFGSDSKEHFAYLRNFYGKEMPLMVMEYWIGWFTAWGNEKINRAPHAEQLADLKNILDVGHVNFYMFHGGTNFGFWNGANYYDGLSPDITSYDYDAPLTEWGDITDKYKAYREIIQSYTDTPLPALPENPVRKDYGTLEVKERTALFNNLDNLTEKVERPYPLRMEELDQSMGYVLYRHDLGVKRPITDFRLLGTADRAQVYINGEHQFTQYDKELGKTKQFKLVEEQNQLDILVENMGRINYGEKVPHQSKGITDNLYVNGAFRSDWTHYPLSLDNIEKVDFTEEYIERTPSFSRFELEIEAGELADTFIDMTGWGKGAVYINGFNLGRYWEIGPQFKLYLPAPLLKEGKNEIVVFETEGRIKETLTFTDQAPA